MTPCSTRATSTRVEGCEVPLSGTVESRAMKRRAEDIAASIRGVVDVHNRLRIGREDDARDREPERSTHAPTVKKERTEPNVQLRRPIPAHSSSSLRFERRIGNRLL